MSDLRSEMVSKVLNQWDTPQKSSVKTLGERIYDYVKAHPYASVDEVERGLGVGKEASISSYLKAHVDKGLLAREEKLRMPYPGHGSRYYFVYYHISDTYNLPRKPRKPREVKIKVAKPVEHVAVAPTPPRMKQVEEAFDAHKFVKNLNVADAKELYLILEGYFGD